MRYQSRYVLPLLLSFLVSVDLGAQLLIKEVYIVNNKEREVSPPSRVYIQDG